MWLWQFQNFTNKKPCLQAMQIANIRLTGLDNIVTGVLSQQKVKFY
jgi:hypothetical protein